MRIENQQLDFKELFRDDKVDKKKELDKIINEYRKKEGSLIIVLHDVQKLIGFLPREVLIYIALSLDIPLAEVYSVVSFYSLFSMQPRGKYTIEVCTGTACYVKGSDKIFNELKEQLNIEPGEVTPDGMFTIETTRCKGACSLAPVISIGDNIYSKVTEEKITEILDEYRGDKIDAEK